MRGGLWRILKVCALCQYIWINLFIADAVLSTVFELPKGVLDEIDRLG